jgi:hypothetical protein
MCISQIERATLYLTKNIYIKNIYVPNLIRNKVIKYPRGFDKKNLLVKDLTFKEKRKIVNLNFITY